MEPAEEVDAARLHLKLEDECVRHVHLEQRKIPGDHYPVCAIMLKQEEDVCCHSEEECKKVNRVATTR